MDPRLLKLRKDNRSLCESRTRVPVSETLTVLVADATIAAAAIAEAKREGRNPKFLLGKVGHADRNNENDRVYPRGEWLANIERINKETGPGGSTVGAVDHQGCAEGGNLKTSPIIWRKLEIKEDGAVFGEFEVVRDHSAGKDLIAQIESGMQVGFSTFGYATAHRPSKDEAERYGLAYDEGVDDDDYDGPVIIDKWELVKIDAVDNPAVRDARLVRDNRDRGGAALTDNGNTGGTTPAENTEMDIKTLDDLRAKLPEVYALHQAAVDSLQKQVDALKGGQSKYDAIVKKLGESLLCLAQEHGAQIPLRDGADVNKELEATVAELTAKLADSEKAAGAKDAERAELQSKLDAVAAERADAKRRADVAARAVELLKDNRFADAIRKILDRQIGEAAFDVAAVEQLVKDKTEEYEAVAPRRTAGAPATAPKGDDGGGTADGIKGLTVFSDDLDDDDEGDADDDGVVREVKGLACLAE